MNSVYFKIKVWERIYIPDETVNTIKQGIENGTITCSNDLYNIEEIRNLDWEILPETSQQISIEENNKQATIELFVDTKKLTTNLNLKN